MKIKIGIEFYLNLGEIIRFFDTRNAGRIPNVFPVPKMYIEKITSMEKFTDESK